LRFENHRDALRVDRDADRGDECSGGSHRRKRAKIKEPRPFYVSRRYRARGPFAGKRRHRGVCNELAEMLNFFFRKRARVRSGERSERQLAAAARGEVGAPLRHLGGIERALVERGQNLSVGTRRRTGGGFRSFRGEQVREHALEGALLSRVPVSFAIA
jgi:hypothetical protein